MFDMMKMMGKVKEMQARMKEAQDKLADIRVEAESGAGMVKAVVNGQKKLISIEIDQALMKEDDREMLQDLVVAAVNKATDEAEIQAKEEIKRSTEGIMPNIPGLDLSGMM